MKPSFITQRALITIVRILTGLFMVYHGMEVFQSEKMAEYAKWESLTKINGPIMAYLGKGAEFVSGLLLAFGWNTRFGGLLMAATLAYIAFFIGNGKVWYDDQHPFLFVLLGIVFYAIGGGLWSVDEWLENRKK
jgi:putative oxidoreductase